MPDIQQLSPSVVNQIAAGEVVERPASVVKELMENAIDAGAGRIDVTVEQGGMELVRVVDDGCGIAAEQLLLAVAPHATSKIRQADDLFRVGTLGFRGEALASIAEVSRFVLRSRPAGRRCRRRVGSDRRAARRRSSPCGCPVGHDDRSPQSVLQHAGAAKISPLDADRDGPHQRSVHAAGAGPSAGGIFRCGSTTSWSTICRRPTTGSSGSPRCSGAELAEQLIWVESHDGDVRLSGYVANPTQSRGNQKMQYLFLNGRAIRDRSLQHALGEAYRGLLLTGRYPVALLQIEMPAEAVDVNVHPTKLEVRFQDGGRLYSQLLGTLRTRFLTTDLTAKYRPNARWPPASSLAAMRHVEPAVAFAAADPTGGHDAARAAQMREELVRWAKGELAAVGGAGRSANRLPC